MEQFLSSYTTLLLALIAAMLGVAVIVLAVERALFLKSKVEPKEHKVLVKALWALFCGNKNTALEMVKKAAKTFPEEPLLFLIIVSHVRENYPHKSMVLHRSLLFRKNLSSEERGELLKNLGLDYLALDKKPNAVAALKQAFSAHKSPQIVESLIKALIENRDFEAALKMQKELNKIKKEDKSAGTESIIHKAISYFFSMQESLELKNWSSLLSKYGFS